MFDLSLELSQKYGQYQDHLIQPCHSSDIECAKRLNTTLERDGISKKWSFDLSLELSQKYGQYQDNLREAYLSSHIFFINRLQQNTERYQQYLDDARNRVRLRLHALI